MIYKCGGIIMNKCSFIPENMRSFERSVFSIAKTFNAVDLRAMNNDVVIRFTDVSEARVELIFMKKYFEFSPEVKVENDTLRILADYDLASDLKIIATLPKKHYSSFNLKSSNGQVSVEGLSSENIELCTSNASIDFVGEATNIILKTENGKIQMQFLSLLVGKTFVDAKTTNGTVYLTLPNKDSVYLSADIENISNFNGRSRDIFGLPLIKDTVNSSQRTVEMGDQTANIKIFCKISTTNGSVIIR